MGSLDCVVCVIRTTSERTATLCTNYSSRQNGDNPIFVIREVPFSVAVRKTFELGIKYNRKWTLAVDADILLRSDAIRDLVNIADSLPDNFFMVQGRVLDKLFCFSRNGGPHLFRTSMLKEALSLVPDQQETIRPEAETVNRMVKKGFHRYKGKEIYGLHDFEQFYLDIFCTAFAHAVKFPYLQNYFMREWLHREAHDKDYQVARLGYALGLGYKYSTMPSKEEIRYLGIKFLHVLGIEEKSGDVTQCDVDFVMQNFRISKEAKEIEDKNHSIVLRTDKNEKLPNTILHGIGKRLEKFGRRLQ